MSSIHALHLGFDTRWKFAKNVAPVADFVGADRAVGVFAGADDEMDGGLEGCGIVGAHP